MHHLCGESLALFLSFMLLHSGGTDGPLPLCCSSLCPTGISSTRSGVRPEGLKGGRGWQAPCQARNVRANGKCIT